MLAHILGSAAGGGFPQWNCGCENCQKARRGLAKPRTQDSVALGALGAASGDWVLLNASPDILTQIQRAPALTPRGPRRSPIRGVVLTNGDLDHCLGLFSLREWQPLVLYATESVRRGLALENAMFRTLERFPGQVSWVTLELGRAVRLRAPDGEDLGVEIIARPSPGKLPVHLAFHGRPSPEDNIGIWVRDLSTGRTLAYVPGAASLDGLAPHLDEADCVLFDGTFWSSDELVALGLSQARAEDMAHMPVGGLGGSLEKLAALRAPRRIYTHINNSNPLLIEGSAERREVAAAGWQVAEDGMEIEL
jgi:pyrroloquinoline quinone biosynthesis protein B